MTPGLTPPLTYRSTHYCTSHCNPPRSVPFAAVHRQQLHRTLCGRHIRVPCTCNRLTCTWSNNSDRRQTSVSWYRQLPEHHLHPPKIESTKKYILHFVYQNTNYYTILTNSYSGFRPLAMAFRFRVAKVAEMHVPVSNATFYCSLSVTINAISNLSSFRPIPAFMFFALFLVSTTFPAHACR